MGENESVDRERERGIGGREDAGGGNGERGRRMAQRRKPAGVWVGAWEGGGLERVRMTRAAERCGGAGWGAGDGEQGLT